MKRNLLLLLLFNLSFLLTQANSLLTNPQTGQPFATGTINDFELVSNGTDVVLIIANNATRKLYAIDINDNDPSDSASNAITKITDFISEVEAAIGITNLTVQNFEVNPISKSVYVLVSDASNNTYMVVVKNNGADITSLNLNNVSYVTITFTTGTFEVQDMTWGNNTLFISSGGWALDGEVGRLSAPFAHNSSTTNRSTTMFKSNWGGGYYTTAPLEKFAFATIDNKDRLMGVTICAPGFSFETTSLTGAGVLQVDEQFDVNSMPPIKTVAVEQNDTTYLFDLHENWMGGRTFIRVGQKYIDGSRVTANQHNNNRVQLRDFGGNRPMGLTDADVKIYNSTFKMIAYYTDFQFLVLDGNNHLRLFNTSCEQVTADFSSEEDSTNSLIYSFDAENVTSGTYSWDFGDGNNANGKNVMHTYGSGGTYTVCLTVNNSCNTDITCYTVTLPCDSVTTDFSYISNPSATYSIDFSADSIPDGHYYWTFGDGSIDNGRYASHTYDSAGTYNVCLKANNNCSTDSICKTIIISDPSGIKSIKDNSSLVRIYPNPATDWLSIHHADKFPGNSQLIIYSMDGKEVYKTSLIKQDQRIQLSVLRQGVYLVTVVTDEQNIFIDRLIIN